MFDSPRRERDVPTYHRDETKMLRKCFSRPSDVESETTPWKKMSCELLHLVSLRQLSVSLVCLSVFRYTGAPYFAAISAMKVVSTLLLLLCKQCLLDEL